MPTVISPPSKGLLPVDSKHAERVSATLAAHDLEQRLERAEALIAAARDQLRRLSDECGEEGQEVDSSAFIRPLLLIDMAEDELGDRDALNRLKSLAESVS